jgi:hypothetical protein
MAQRTPPDRASSRHLLARCPRPLRIVRRGPVGPVERCGAASSIRPVRLCHEGGVDIHAAGVIASGVGERPARRTFRGDGVPGRSMFPAGRGLAIRDHPTHHRAVARRGVSRGLPDGARVHGTFPSDSSPPGAPCAIRAPQWGHRGRQSRALTLSFPAVGGQIVPSPAPRLVRNHRSGPKCCLSDDRDSHPGPFFAWFRDGPAISWQTRDLKK